MKFPILAEDLSVPQGLMLPLFVRFSNKAARQRIIVLIITSPNSFNLLVFAAQYDNFVVSCTELEKFMAVHATPTNFLSEITDAKSIHGIPTSSAC